MDIVEKLRERLRILEIEIESMTKLAEGYRKVIADNEQSDEIDEGVVSKRVPKELRNTVVAIMREESHPLHYKQIYERLKARGIAVRGKEPARNIIAHMSQDLRFVNVGRGMWTLISLQGQTLTNSKDQREEL